MCPLCYFCIFLCVFLGGWPFQIQTSEVRWYYFISFGHYIHLFVTQFFEPKRKDWWEMFIHHLVTMALLFFSYIVSFLRIGVVVLLCHDVSDVMLELAKLFNYLKLGTLCDTTFTLFAVTFFLGRLVLYPWRVIYVALGYANEQVGVWKGFYIFVIWLFMLQILHVFWFYTIVKMIVAFAAKGEVEKDAREETESEPEDTTGEEKIKSHRDALDTAPPDGSSNNGRKKAIKADSSNDDQSSSSSSRSRTSRRSPDTAKQPTTNSSARPNSPSPSPNRAREGRRQSAHPKAK